MASFEPTIRMDENAFIPREKIQQPKMGRKALTDVTNSKKPVAEDNSSVNYRNSLKAPEKVAQPKIRRKPLGFLHNHNECMKANHMSMDYFLETVALKRDSSAIQLPQLYKSSTLELDISMTIEEMEFVDISAPPSPQTPSFAGSPSRDLDFKNMELSPLRLKDTPVMVKISV